MMEISPLMFDSLVRCPIIVYRMMGPCFGVEWGRNQALRLQVFLAENPQQIAQRTRVIVHIADADNRCARCGEYAQSTDSEPRMPLASHTPAVTRVPVAPKQGPTHVSNDWSTTG